MDNKYQSEFLGSLHETATGLHKAGVINDDEMREYDQDCLVREGGTTPLAGSSRSKPAAPAFTVSRH
jgi:DNA-binding transcriptional regulator YiaG